jgi:hypothetical protein
VDRVFLVPVGSGVFGSLGALLVRNINVKGLTIGVS